MVTNKHIHTVYSHKQAHTHRTQSQTSTYTQYIVTNKRIHTIHSHKQAHTHSA